MVTICTLGAKINKKRQKWNFYLHISQILFIFSGL